MKPQPILNTSKGLDVVSPETELPAGAVRTADNIVIRDGGFDRRPGYTLDLELAQAGSLWRGTRLTLVKAGSTLYRLTGKVGALASTAIATGLWSAPAAYAEHNGSVYVSAGRLLRIDADDQVRTPGVASLLGIKPGLLEITGGLVAGRYGIAVSAVDDRGEESGLSEVAWLELAAAGGIRVVLSDFPVTVSGYRIYRTEPNGETLYLAAVVGLETSCDLRGEPLGRAAHSEHLDLLPAGTSLAFLNGRLYSAIGSFVFFSEPFNPGLYQPRQSFFAFESDVTTLVAVEGGLYVGTETAVHFLRGSTPDQLQLATVSPIGAFAGSGLTLEPSLLALEVGSRDVACWLSPRGLQVGTADGTVISPQADRIRLDGVPSAPMHAFVQDGVRQLLAATPVMTLGDGGATDSTP